jgi:trimethylamine:corrinoid methyltransferase-like protein
MLDSAALLSLPQAVIDDEIAAAIQILLADVSVDEDSVQAEAIERIGIGGSFLAEKETRQRVRGFMRPAVASRLPYQAWKEAGRDELQAATERVEEILGRRRIEPEPIDTETAERVCEACGVRRGSQGLRLQSGYKESGFGGASRHRSARSCHGQFQDRT